MLIECPVCGGSVSRAARACPHCGHPANYARRQYTGSQIVAAAWMLIGIGLIVAASPPVFEWQVLVGAVLMFACGAWLAWSMNRRINIPPFAK